LKRKGFQNFLDAWARLPPESHVHIRAVIVGDGDSLAELKAQASATGLSNVHFAGSQSAEQLARYYAAADIFVLPSLEDVWGLVVNEAMCFGLPVLASQFAGASQSLVAGSGLGVVFNPANIEEFAHRMQEWAQDPPPRATAACRRRLEHLTFDRSIAALDDMIAQIGPDRMAARA
jgi:glycosyltransferase involved in cell wall biosynthesis